jgi:integrase
VNGRQRKKSFLTLKDAKKYQTKVQADTYSGLIIDPSGGERLFEPFANEWLETRLVKGVPLSPSTKSGYVKLLRRNIYPTFDKTRLRQITPEKVRRWHDTIVATKGADQAAKSYRLLRAILNTALADELIARNPCLIKGAGLEADRDRPMPPGETVLQLADAITQRLRALVLLAGFIGLRSGELLGLQRHDVDLLHRTVRVERQAQEIAGVGRILTTPKTEAGNRVRSLPDAIAEEIELHLKSYVAAEPEAFLFTRPSGLPLRRADLSRAWRAALEAVGLGDTDTHIQDLRHTAATLLARKPGITIKELMASIGHASPRAALIYQHATEERDKESADYLDAQIAAFKAPKRSRKRSKASTKVRVRA